VRADRPAVPMNLLLVQSCITDLPECRLAALRDNSDLGQPGVRIDVFDFEHEHLVHLLSMARGVSCQSVGRPATWPFRSSAHGSAACWTVL
jgi:hypothetical protein